VIQIMLVADDPGFRDRLKLALERLELTGEEVSFLEAADGNPDLVVAEVSVGSYGGFGLTRDLKSNPETAGPVILVLDRFQDEWLGRWSGADALVNRPVDPFALAQVASQLLAEEQGEAALEGAVA
jgi:DNA-binding response OmpR family regulator